MCSGSAIMLISDEDPVVLDATKSISMRGWLSRHEHRGRPRRQATRAAPPVHGRGRYWRPHRGRGSPGQAPACPDLPAPRSPARPARPHAARRQDQGWQGERRSRHCAMPREMRRRLRVAAPGLPPAGRGRPEPAAARGSQAAGPQPASGGRPAQSRRTRHRRCHASSERDALRPGSGSSRTTSIATPTEIGDQLLPPGYEPAAGSASTFRAAGAALRAASSVREGYQEADTGHDGR